MTRGAKRENVAETVAERIREGRYRLSNEARSRMQSRQVVWPEISAVLRGGVHHHEYDQWSEEHESWNYAIEGDTIEGRTLRIPVSFLEEGDVLVVTIIEVQQRSAP